MYSRTIKNLTILLKWHRLLALHGIGSFPVSISCAGELDPDPNWDVVLLHHSRIGKDYRQKLQTELDLMTLQIEIFYDLTNRVSTGVPLAHDWADQRWQVIKSVQEKTQRQEGCWDASKRNDGGIKREDSPACLNFAGCCPEKASRCWTSLGQTTREAEKSHKENREETP